VGKGTFFVPAAHGSDQNNNADPEGVDDRSLPRLRVRENLGRDRPDIRPLQGRRFKGSPTVGGGHKKRALAHGYSIFTPAGFSDRPRTEFGTPGVQPKIWVTISPLGGEGQG
jgi:hypothetical protein